MSTRQAIREQAEVVETMGMIVQTFQEISVMKMQAVRKSVLHSRDFLDQLSSVFGDVKGSYRKQILAMIEKNKKLINEASLLNKNGKTVSVLISTNNKLYGDIGYKVFNLFNDNITKNNDDILIVGKLGKELYEQYGKVRSYQYFEVPDKELTIEDLRQVVEAVVAYNKINVFYGKFESIVVQNPTQKNITGNEETTTTTTISTADKVRFLFEPALKNVLQFFETQVFNSLFKQTMSEARLAAHASRITSMEESLVHIDEEKKQYRILERQASRAIYNKKQLEMLSGISLWIK